jgi:hypothetical protein
MVVQLFNTGHQARLEGRFQGSITVELGRADELNTQYQSCVYCKLEAFQHQGFCGE